MLDVGLKNIVVIRIKWNIYKTIIFQKIALRLNLVESCPVDWLFVCMLSE